jgi:hypothetical protein
MAIIVSPVTVPMMVVSTSVRPHASEGIIGAEGLIVLKIAVLIILLSSPFGAWRSWCKYRNVGDAVIGTFMYPIGAAVLLMFLALFAGGVEFLLS